MEQFEYPWLWKILRKLHDEGYNLEETKKDLDKFKSGNDALLEKARRYLYSTNPEPSVTWYRECYFDDIIHEIGRIIDDAIKTKNKQLILNILKVCTPLGIRLKQKYLDDIEDIIKSEEGVLINEIRDILIFLNNDENIKKEILEFLSKKSYPTMAYKYYNLLNRDDPVLKKEIKNHLITNQNNLQKYFDYLEICLYDNFFIDEDLIKRIEKKGLEEGLVSKQLYAAYLLKDEKKVKRLVNDLKNEFE